MALRDEAEEGVIGDLIDRAQRDAHQAIVLAPELADGHLALGRFFISTLDIAQANDEISRAVALAPGNVETLRSYGNLVSTLGQPDAGIAAIRHAAELDPLNVKTYLALAAALQRTRHYDEAIAAYREALTLEPGVPIRPLDSPIICLAASRALARRANQSVTPGAARCVLPSLTKNLVDTAMRKPCWRKCGPDLLTREPMDIRSCMANGEISPRHSNGWALLYDRGIRTFCR